LSQPLSPPWTALTDAIDRGQALIFLELTVDGRADARPTAFPNTHWPIRSGFQDPTGKKHGQSAEGWPPFEIISHPTEI
jgi:hypothetical protein